MTEFIPLGDEGNERPIFKHPVRYYPANDEAANHIGEAIDDAERQGQYIVDTDRVRVSYSGQSSHSVLFDYHLTGMQRFAECNAFRPELIGPAMDDNVGETITLEVVFPRGVLYLRNVPLSYVKQGEVPKHWIARLGHSFMMKLRKVLPRRAMSQEEIDRLFSDDE